MKKNGYNPPPIEKLIHKPITVAPPVKRDYVKHVVYVIQSDNVEGFLSGQKE